MDRFHSEELGKLVLRLTVGLLILFHGIDKVVHPGTLDYIAGMLGDWGLPQRLAYAVYLGEVVAPLMVIFGIFARLGGLLILINMVFALLLVHTGDLFRLTEHGGWALELQACYLFGGLAVALLGSGRLALRPD